MECAHNHALSLYASPKSSFSMGLVPGQLPSTIASQNTKPRAQVLATLTDTDGEVAVQEDQLQHQQLVQLLRLRQSPAEMGAVTATAATAS